MIDVSSVIVPPVQNVMNEGMKYCFLTFFFPFTPSATRFSFLTFNWTFNDLFTSSQNLNVIALVCCTKCGKESSHEEEKPSGGTLNLCETSTDSKWLVIIFISQSKTGFGILIKNVCPILLANFKGCSTGFPKGATNCLKNSIGSVFLP